MISNSLKSSTDSETHTNVIDLEGMEIKAETPDPAASEMDVDKDELDCYLDAKSAYRQGKILENGKPDEDPRGKEMTDLIQEWTAEKLEMVENTVRKLDKVAEQYKKNLAPRLEKYHNEMSGNMPVSLYNFETLILGKTMLPSNLILLHIRTTMLEASNLGISKLVSLP